MTTLIVGAVCLLLAHLVCEWRERKRVAALDDAAADHALYMLAPDFAAELGCVPPKPLIRNVALVGLIAGLHEQQKRREAEEKAQAQRRRDALAAMMQAPPPNAYAQFSNEMNAQYKNSLLAQMGVGQSPLDPKSIRPSDTIGGMFGRYL